MIPAELMNGIAPFNAKLKWKRELSDDCVCEYGDYSLHAEKMSSGNWWWAVDRPQGRISSHDSRTPCHTGVQARQAADHALFAQIRGEPAKADLVALALLGDRIRLVSLQADGTFQFADMLGNGHEIYYRNIIRSKFLLNAIEELEYLINQSGTKERELQEFFKRYPDFILNDDYKAAHSHVVLSENLGDRLIPDFILEPFRPEGLSDLLELKLPSTAIYALKKNRVRYSAAVLEACAQLREYANYFDLPDNRQRIADRYGINIYKPRMIVVIGRRGKLNLLIVRQAESDLPQLKLLSYDDIIDRMRRRAGFDRDSE